MVVVVEGPGTTGKQWEAMVTQATGTSVELLPILPGAFCLILHVCFEIVSLYNPGLS